MAAAGHRAALGRRSVPTSGGCSSGWPRSSPDTSPTATTSWVGCSTSSNPPASSTTRSSWLVSDNGASGEGGPDGTFNEWRFFNGMRTPTELSLEHIDELGGPTSYNHYNTGWAWAFDTPFPYWKRWAGYEGGVADMCLVAWPDGIEARGEVRHQYVHAVDVVPDPLRPARHRAARGTQGLPAEPDRGRELRGVAHRPRGAGTTDPVLRDAGAALDLPRRVAGLHRAPAAERLGQLRHTTCGSCTSSPTDRAQSTDLAAREPARLETLKSLWYYYAGIYNGLPLDDRTALEQVLAERPHGSPERDRYVYYPDCAAVPEQSGVVTSGRSYTIAAGVDVDSPDAEGVLYAHGGVAGGHSLYVKDHRLHYAFNWVGSTLQAVDADREIRRAGTCSRPSSRRTAAAPIPTMPGAAGTLTLYMDDQEVGSDDIVTQPGSFCLVGDGICVGRDDASPVTPDYEGAVPVHRRRDRQGRRRRLRRTLRRSRGAGTRLVHDGLIAGRPPAPRLRRAAPTPSGDGCPPRQGTRRAALLPDGDETPSGAAKTGWLVFVIVLPQ